MSLLTSANDVICNSRRLSVCLFACLCVSDFKYSADVYENLTIDVSGDVASRGALGHVPP